MINSCAYRLDTVCGKSIEDEEQKLFVFQFREFHKINRNESQKKKKYVNVCRMRMNENEYVARAHIFHLIRIHRFSNKDKKKTDVFV